MTLLNSMAICQFKLAENMYNVTSRKVQQRINLGQNTDGNML